MAESSRCGPAWATLPCELATHTLSFLDSKSVARTAVDRLRRDILRNDEQVWLQLLHRLPHFVRRQRRPPRRASSSSSAAAAAAAAATAAASATRADFIAESRWSRGGQVAPRIASPESGSVDTLALSYVPAGQHLLAAGGSDGGVRVQRIGQGREHGTKGTTAAATLLPPGGSPIKCMTWVRNSVGHPVTLVCGSADGSCRGLCLSSSSSEDPATASPAVGFAQALHRGAVHSLAAFSCGDSSSGSSGSGGSSGSSLVASTSFDSTARVFDVEAGGTLVRTLEGHDGQTYGLATIGAALLLTCSYDHTIKLWDLRAPQPCASTFYGHVGPSWEVKVLEGRRMGSSRISSSPAVLSSSSLPAPLPSLPASSSCELPLQFVSSSSDGTVRLWDARQGTMATAAGGGDGAAPASTSSLFTFVARDEHGFLADPGGVNGFDVMHDEDMVVAGYDDGAIRAFCVRTGAMLHHCMLDRMCYVRRVRASGAPGSGTSAGKVVAATSTGHVIAFGARRQCGPRAAADGGKEEPRKCRDLVQLSRWQPHENHILSLSLGEDLVVTGDNDGYIRMANFSSSLGLRESPSRQAAARATKENGLGQEEEEEDDEDEEEKGGSGGSGGSGGDSS